MFWERPGRVTLLVGLAHMETDSLQMSPNLAGIGSMVWVEGGWNEEVGDREGDLSRESVGERVLWGQESDLKSTGSLETLHSGCSCR